MAPVGKTRSVSLILFVLVAGLIVQGCDLLFPGRDETMQADVVRSDKERVTSPDVDQAELDELVAGNSGFGFDLFQELRNSDGNLFYSPYSISIALAIAFAGARGDTETQMEDVLYFSLGQERLHPTFNALDLKLASRNELPEGWEGEGFALNIANSTWGQTGHSFLSGFLDVLAEDYGAGLRLLDFMSAPEAARNMINDWVSDETEGKIEDLLPPGSVDSATRLVLANAIYFNAPWQYPFEEEATHDSTFTLLGGSEVTVPMMEQEQLLAYAEGEDYQAVELPYNGRQLSMLILLPQVDSFHNFEESLTSEQFTSIVTSLETRNVHLKMPKFTYELDFSLKDTLSGMGMVDAFQLGVADFSGMDGTRFLFIGDVVHKAFVSVDEAGTEAAAATAVIMPTIGPPTSPVVITIDHPFFFAIRDIETQAILFLGRVLNPNQS